MRAAAGGRARHFVDLTGHIGGVDQRQRQAGRCGHIPLGDIQVGIGGGVLRDPNIDATLLGAPAPTEDIVVKRDLGHAPGHFETVLRALAEIPNQRTRDAAGPHGHQEPKIGPKIRAKTLFFASHATSLNPPSCSTSDKGHHDNRQHTLIPPGTRVLIHLLSPVGASANAGASWHSRHTRAESATKSILRFSVRVRLEPFFCGPGEGKNTIWNQRRTLSCAHQRRAKSRDPTHDRRDSPPTGLTSGLAAPRAALRTKRS